MNEEVKDALMALLKQVAELTQDGIVMAQEQIPDILKQIIIRDRILYTFWAIICIAAFAVFAVSVRKLSSSGEEDPALALQLIVTGVFSIIGFITLCCEIIPNGLTVWFAPKLYLIEELSMMMS